MPRKTIAQRKRARLVKKGRARLNAHNSSTSEDTHTRVTDVIADVLHLIPEPEWSEALGSSVWHAYEEEFGDNTIEPVRVYYEIYPTRKWRAA